MDALFTKKENVANYSQTITFPVIQNEEASDSRFRKIKSSQDTKNLWKTFQKNKAKGKIRLEESIS